MSSSKSGSNSRHKLPTKLVTKAPRQFALRGCLVTMGDRGVIKDGVVWIAGGAIAAVTDAKARGPAGFSGITPFVTGATIYPGFMDLHNHLAYGILPLWNVPGSYENRDEWKDEPSYDQLVKRPLSILRHLPDAIAAICRYSECKALFGGATTSHEDRRPRAHRLRTTSGHCRRLLF